MFGGALVPTPVQLVIWQWNHNGVSVHERDRCLKYQMTGGNVLKQNGKLSIHYLDMKLGCHGNKRLLIDCIWLSLSQWWTSTWYPNSCRAETNCPIASWVASGDWSPSKKIFCRMGSTSATRSQTSSCRASAMRCPTSLDRYRVVVVVNGCKTSNHCALSMSSCGCGCQCWSLRMSRRSKVGRKGKNKPHICARDESCQSTTLDEIVNLKVTWSTVPVFWESLTLVEWP